MSHKIHPPEARIKAGPLWRLVKEYLARSDDSFDTFRNRLGVTVEASETLKSGEGFIHFGQADKIVTYIDVFAWHSEPDLAAEYRRVDLAWLDRYQPVDRKWSQGTRKRTHGKMGTYAHGCRCDLCMQARKDYYQRQKAARLAAA